MKLGNWKFNYELVKIVGLKIILKKLGENTVEEFEEF